MRSLLGLACAMLAQVTLAGSFESGLEAKKSGRLEEAALLLEKASQEHPRNAEVWFHYGTVLGWQNQHDEALIALRKGLAEAPHDFDLRLAEARVLAWQSDYVAASQRLKKLEEEYPNDLDVQVMLGRVAGWQENRKEARVRYEGILRTNPQQIDALTGLGDLEAEEQHLSQARGYYERAQSIDPSPDIQKRLDNLSEMRHRRLDTGITASTFDRGERDDWWSVYASYQQRFGSWDFWLRMEVGERFALQDETWELGLTHAITPWLRATLYGGFTPDADFSADWYSDLSLRWRIFEDLGPMKDGWLLTEFRWADYVTSGLSVTRFGWEQNLGKGWTINARWLRFEYESGLSADGWLAYVTWEPKERWMIRAGAGSSVESITNQTLQADRTIPSWTVFVGVLLPVSEKWQIRFDLEREDVQDSIVRYGMSLGLSRRF